MNRFAFPPILYLGVAAAAIVAAIAALVWWYRGSSGKAGVIDWPTFAAPEETPPAVAPVIPAAIAQSHPTKVTFHLRLPTQGQARSAGQIARREGYVADVRPPSQGDVY